MYHLSKIASIIWKSFPPWKTNSPSNRVSRDISGKTVKITGILHGNTLSEEVDPQSEGKV